LRALYKLESKVNNEKVGLKTGTGNSHERSGGNVLAQTVSHTSSSDRKNQTVESTISDEDEA